MFHEVRVNILEMNGKMKTLKKEIETIKEGTKLKFRTEKYYTLK